MILSNRQTHMLFQVAIDSLPIEGMFKYSTETRRFLINKIINQQGDDLIDLKIYDEHLKNGLLKNSFDDIDET